MSCRQCQGIEAVFDEKEARKDLKSYRKKGPASTTQMLIDALKAEGVAGASVLDIGGGVGVLHHELLQVGAASATGVDASAAYIDAAMEEAQRRGHAGRVGYHHGDFVAVAKEIEPAEVVTLDKVICCYHDVEGLVGLSSRRATRLYGLVYPRDTWAAKVFLRVANFLYWIRRNPFRVFVHDTALVDSAVRANGLKRCFFRTTLVWQVVVYAR